MCGDKCQSFSLYFYYTFNKDLQIVTYLVFNNFILQYGSETWSSAKNAGKAITYPITFTTYYAMVTSPRGTGAFVGHNITAFSVSGFEASFYCNQSERTTGMYWIACGY